MTDDTTHGAVTPVDDCTALVLVTNRRQRKGTRRPRATRHGVLCKSPLEALRSRGENIKALRQIEREFRADLKPQGASGEAIFDRFWTSYLRCVLAARTEEKIFMRQGDEAPKGKTVPRLIDGGDVPTLLVEHGTEHGISLEGVEADTLRELALVQRYDKHFSHQMFFALGLLLVMRRGGEDGLEAALASAFAIGSK